MIIWVRSRTVNDADIDATRNARRARPPTDEELVARARAKDFGAFEQLLDRYEDKIFRLAYRFVRNETEAKEILQDTFLSIWRKLDTFKGDAQFGELALPRRGQHGADAPARAAAPPGDLDRRAADRLPRQLRPAAAAGRELGEAARRRAAVGRAAPPHPVGGRRAARRSTGRCS